MACTLEPIVQVGDSVAVSMSSENNDNTKEWWILASGSKKLRELLPVASV